MLWRLGGEAMNARPRDSAPRLYIDSLNAMIDQQGVRLAGLNNHPPNAVLLLELLGAALALGMLALYVSVLGRGLLSVVLAAVVVTFLVLVTFDLDRPTRGVITIPASPLLAEKATMNLPPRRLHLGEAVRACDVGSEDLVRQLQTAEACE